MNLFTILAIKCFAIMMMQMVSDLSIHVQTVLLGFSNSDCMRFHLVNAMYPAKPKE